MNAARVTRWQKAAHRVNLLCLFRRLDVPVQSPVFLVRLKAA